MSKSPSTLTLLRSLRKDVAIRDEHILVVERQRDMLLEALEQCAHVLSPDLSPNGLIERIDMIITTVRSEMGESDE